MEGVAERQRGLDFDDKRQMSEHDKRRLREGDFETLAFEKSAEAGPN